MPMTRWNRWATVALLMALAGCPRPGTDGAAEAEASAASPPVPLLWKVSDADNSVYLMGSFHLLKPDDYPLAESAESAFADAEHVVFELSPAEMADPALGQKMMQAALLPPDQPLQAQLSPETFARLEAWAARRSQPIAALQRFEPWYVGLVVGVTEMQALGLSPEHGLDKHFAGRATEAGKAVAGLERVDDQIALFDSLDPALQRQSLEETLAEVEAMEQRVAQMHALWRAGDGEGLYALTGAEMKAEYPALYERMNTARNLAWLPRVKAMLDAQAEDDALVVVGALHLLGEDGLVDLLEAEGYTVERL